MVTRKVSTEISQVVYIEVDGEKFARVTSTLSSTISQLRNILYENCRLSSNTYFVDTLGYLIVRKDEQIYVIKQLLRDNGTIQMKTGETIRVEKTATKPSDIKKQGEIIFNKSGTFILTELLNILGWLWCLILKPMVIITLMFLFLYYGYTKLICRHGRFLPLITMYCPADQLEFLSLPPVSELAETSASLADTLINADVSAPMRFIQAKTSLIMLRNQVKYSDIDVTVREKLSEQMGDLQKRVQTGADELTIMLASFGGALDKLRIYTEFALEDLSKVINPRMFNDNYREQIGYTEMEVTDKLTKSFEGYVTSVVEQIDKILLKAQLASMSLESIKDKLETIQELNFKGKFISEKRIDELKYASFWSQLFDEGKLGIAKHERSLKTLDGFIDFVNNALNNIGDVIIKLKHFKTDAEELKQTGILLEHLPKISADKHVQLLKAALKRLVESKKQFEGKTQQAKQQDEIL